MARSTLSSPSPLEHLEPRRLLAAGPLLDDAYEPNDTLRQVLALPAPGGPWLGGVEGELEIGGLRLADRADWFRFRLTAEGQADDTVAIEFKNRRGNLDLALFNSRGRVELDSSITNRPTESINLDGLAPGWYMVKVTGRGGAHNPSYSLAFQCPADTGDGDGSGNGGDEGGDGGGDGAGDIPLVEYNDSFDLVDTAPVGIPGSPNLGALSGSLQFAQSLDDSYDIFKFTVSAAPGAGAHVSIASATPFNLSLFNAQRQSIGFAAGYMGQTSVSLVGLAPGDYYLQVTHYVLGLDGAFDYDLAFDVGGSAQS